MDPKQTAETFNTLQPLLFWLMAALIAVCAIATVVTQNIVRSATWLLFTLAGTSGIFFLLGADLVGATQLLVYVGGTLILVVFGVMLTAQGPFISMKTSGAEWAISIIAGLLLLGVLTTQAVKPVTAIEKPPKVMGTEIITDPTDPENKRTILRFGPVSSDVERYAPNMSRAKRQASVGKATTPVAPPAGSSGVAPGAGKQQAPPPPQGTVPPPLPETDKTVEPEPLDPATSPQSVVLGQGFLGVGVGPAHRDPNVRQHSVIR